MMNSSIKAEASFWTALLILFLALMCMHVVLFYQPDITPPAAQPVFSRTVGHTAVLNPDGTIARNPANTNESLMVNPMEEFSKFTTEEYAGFVNNTFAGVVQDMNRAKFCSNLIAIIGYYLAALACAWSLDQTRKKSVRP